MSYDLYLLPLRFWHGARAASKLLERLDVGESSRQIASVDVRTAVPLLRALEPRYEPFNLDYAEIAQFQNISVDEAKARYTYVELNGPEDLDPPLAQFVFYRNHVAAHWYSGTEAEDLLRYMSAISKVTRLALFDPQDGTVSRLNRRGNFD